VGGYITVNQDSSVDYYAPDADVLLSDTFLAEHCFWTVQGGRDQRGMVGLSFEPTRRKAPAEVFGTVWLDERTFELRFVEYRYTGLGEYGSDSTKIGGQVHFARLPSGAWIVRRWYIRMPQAGRQVSQPVGATAYTPTVLVRSVISQMREEGGDVTAEGLRVFERPAVLTGVVRDSSGAPFSGATVRLPGTAYHAVTGADGRYRLDSLPPGTFDVSVEHPGYRALGVVAAADEAPLAEGAQRSLDLRALNTRALLERLCPGRAPPRTRAALRVNVRDRAAGTPLAFVKIVLHWTERHEVGSSVREEQLEGEGTSDSHGGVVFCDVPANAPVVLHRRTAPESLEMIDTLRLRAGAIGVAEVRVIAKPGAVDGGEDGDGGSDGRADADLILVNGRVITVDRNDRIAQAVAVKGERIVAVGSNAEVEKLAGPRTRRIDLGGRTVTPGLLDAHNHFASGGMERLLAVNLSFPGVRTVADVRARVTEKAAATPAGQWVIGSGWDEGKLEDRRLIQASDLDDVTGDHPVWLQHTTGHYGVANSAALKLAGITGETKDPPGGTIDRGADGTPTGVLKESAMYLVIRHIPPPTPTQEREGMRALAKAFNAEGMTGLKDPGIDDRTWESYAQVLREGALSVRVFALWQGGSSMKDAQAVIAKHGAATRPYAGPGDAHLIAGGVKLYADGSGGARTAWLYDDWNRNGTQVDSGNKGYPAFSPDTLRALIRAYHDAGFHVSVHAIGDRAIDWVVDSYNEVLKANPQRGRRHGIIHANIPTDRAIALMADLERRYDAAYPEPSATFTWWIGDVYAGNFGARRLKRLNPFHTFVEKGIPWAGGSDFFVTPFPARYGIWASIAREPLLGTYGRDAYGRAESVDVHAALKSFTIWAARQMFLEDKIGSIEVGKYADLAVWDRDLYSVPVDQLKEMRCELTVFNGKVVYERGK
jgi:predicted amidohydrolase YtcJ